MLAPLALLLSLAALAHAAHATLWQARGNQEDSEIWRRAITSYQRGMPGPFPIQRKHYYMAGGQSTGVIEKSNLLCSSGLPPYSCVWMNVTTKYDYYAPEVYITDRLDRVEIRRQAPYRNKLDVYLEVQCFPIE